MLVPVIRIADSSHETSASSDVMSQPVADVLLDHNYHSFNCRSSSRSSSVSRKLDRVHEDLLPGDYLQVDLIVDCDSVTDETSIRIIAELRKLEVEAAADPDEDPDKAALRREKIRILVAKLRKRLKESDAKEETEIAELESENEDLIQRLLSLDRKFRVPESFVWADYPPEYAYKTNAQRTKRPPAVNEEERLMRKRQVNNTATRRRELRIIHNRNQRRAQIAFLTEQNQQLHQKVMEWLAADALVAMGRGR